MIYWTGVVWGRLARQSVAAGTFASLAMMPVGLAFKALDMRVGHYGPKVGVALFGELTQPWMQLLLLGQHFVIGWLSALPLLIFWQLQVFSSPKLVHGAVYGAVYYLLVNALALPLIFGDPLPIQLGLPVVVPSLVVHLVFGVAVAWLAKIRNGHWLWGGRTPARV